MKISPCVDTVFKGVPIEVALMSVKQCGYSGFEFWFYKDYDLEEMKELKEKLGLAVINMNSELVSLTDPDKRGEFLKELEKTMKYAEWLDCGCVTVLSGDDTGKKRSVQRESIIAGLREAALLAEEYEITVVLEASNRRVNRPNNYLTSADEAFDIITEAGSSCVKMLYDIYHQQISEGDLLKRIIPNIDKIGHFHAAGVPDRHELYLSEINYDFIFEKIVVSGYNGWIGLEYFPESEPEVGLKRLRRYLG